MCTASAQGVYAGVFPVKCNHDRRVLECVLESGRPFRYGLEVGSKAEMLMAMSMMGRSPGALHAVPQVPHSQSAALLAKGCYCLCVCMLCRPCTAGSLALGLLWFWSSPR